MSGLPDNRRVVDHHHYSRMTKVGASNTYLASDMGRGAREIPTRSSPMARALAHSRGQHNDHDDGDSDDGDEGDDNSDPNGDDNDTPPNASGLGFSATAASHVSSSNLISPTFSGASGGSSSSSISASVVSPTTAGVTAAHTSNASSTAGGIVAALVAIAVLIVVTMFVLRRRRKQGENGSEFDADAFKRQSTILKDDENGGARGDERDAYNPRPPTVIERHIDAPPLSSLQQYRTGTGANANSDGYGNGSEYPATHKPFSLRQPKLPPMSLPSTQAGMQLRSPYDQLPLTSPYPYDSAYNGNDQLHPSSWATYNDQRQPSNGMHANPSRQDSFNSDAHYADASGSSATSLQTAQYAGPLSVTPQGSLAAVTGHTTPVDDASSQGSPFADPHDAHSTQDLVPSSQIYPAVTSAHNGSAVAGLQPSHQRPASIYTDYDEADAYDGI